MKYDKGFQVDPHTEVDILLMPEGLHHDYLNKYRELAKGSSNEYQYKL